jgi:hypothetical protein
MGWHNEEALPELGAGCNEMGAPPATDAGCTAPPATDAGCSVEEPCNDEEAPQSMDTSRNEGVKGAIHGVPDDEGSPPPRSAAAVDAKSASIFGVGSKIVGEPGIATPTATDIATATAPNMETCKWLLKSQTA